MEGAAEPLVSIGLPVFNGEKGIGRALESLLAQEYRHVEIIISDNASTDGTEGICREFAARDSRIKYHRSDVNRGAVWNFNRVFELATGEYFMWAAHDDEREPGYLAACVRRLEQSPTAVLCHSHTSLYIEGRDDLFCVATLDTFERVMGVVDRYRETLQRFPAVAIYGVYRRNAMRQTGLFDRTIASDLAFVQELSIQGPFVQVPRTLFSYFGRQQWNTVDQDYRQFTGQSKKPWWYLPFLVLFVNHWRRIGRADISASLRARLRATLIRYQLGQLALKILIKVLKRTVPARLKERAAAAIYWKWIHSPNVIPGDPALFMERAIKPMVGWWR
jgi:glycosyltransferase involved in cell wall biosynthesis